MNAPSMELVCRLCLRDGPQLALIGYSTVEESNQNIEPTQNLVQLIARYLSIQIIKHESSKNSLICATCRTLVVEWHTFHEFCLKNDEIYQQHSEASTETAGTARVKEERKCDSVAPTDTEDPCYEPVYLSEGRCSEPSSGSRSSSDDEYVPKQPKGKSDSKTSPNEKMPLKKRGRSMTNIVDDEIRNQDQHESSENTVEGETCPEKFVEEKLCYEKSDEERYLVEAVRPKKKVKKRGRPHVLKKAEKRAEVCTICGKFIKNMTEHMRIHNNEKRHQCPYCPKAFVSASNYNSHVNIHTRAKMYKCDLCDKQYAMLNSLKQHRITHFKERIHVCPICGKAYYQPTGLSRHKRTHYEEPKIKCGECDKLFLTNADLRKHFSKHLDEKPFSCEVCSRAFRRKDNLRTHMKTHRASTLPVKNGTPDPKPSITVEISEDARSKEELVTE